MMDDLLTKWLRKISRRYPPEHEICDFKIFGVRFHAFFDDGTFFLNLHWSGRKGTGKWRRISPECGGLSWKDFVDEQDGGAE